MLFARRAAAPARSLLRRQQPRRFGSSSAESHGEHHHHHAEPVNESLGRGFYIGVASIPVGLAVYKFSTSDPNTKPWLTRLIEEYSPSRKTWEERNALHTMAVERAAEDRHLFYSQNPPVTINLSCPEVFNTGSPINVPAGNGSADLTAVVAHYERKNKTIEEQRVAQMKDGKVVSLYEDGRYF
ncbi:hypothetical protein VTO42DRAFT_6642 [Malbranchea cinnamomea]